MKDFFFGLINGYNSLIGTSKIVPAAALSIAAVILLYNDDSNLKRRRINPAVFLLSAYAAISYAAVLCYKKSKRLSVLLLSAVIACMTGSFVFSKTALKKSIYTNGEIYEIIFSIAAIAVYFLIFGLISCRLFKAENDGAIDEKASAKENFTSRCLFLIFIVLLCIFGFYSERLALLTMLLSPLSFSSIILHGILPFLMWLYLVYEDKINLLLDKYFKINTDNDDDGSEDYQEEWDMKKHKILNMRNMTVTVLVIVICFTGMVLVLNNKINTLYDATVLLNNAAGDKAEIYEINSTDGICATIIISSEGAVTVIGGGDKTNGTMLYEELKRHTETVSKWYLYSGEDKDTGAYKFCMDNGITVLNAYVLPEIEEISD